MSERQRYWMLMPDALTSTLEKLGFWLVRTKDFLDLEMKDVDEENGFRRTLKSFVENVAARGGKKNPVSGEEHNRLLSWEFREG